MDGSNYVILLDKRHSMSVDVDYNSTGALNKDISLYSLHWCVL